MPPFPSPQLDAPTPTPTPGAEPESPEINRASFFLSLVPAIATIGGVVILWSFFWLHELYTSIRGTTTRKEDASEGAATAPSATPAASK
ncbi:hypothetical protein GGF31_008034 [Allomyces arbusculus]|nr:hypothetical protein GGF31_008034 [Allomyces arbusculus]